MDEWDTLGGTGEGVAFQAGNAEARRELTADGSTIETACREEAEHARTLARQRAEVLGALVGLLEGWEDATKEAPVAEWLQQAEEVRREACQLVVNSDTIDPVMEDGTMDERIRFLARRILGSVDAQLRRAPQFSALRSTAAYTTLAALVRGSIANPVLDW
jgi:hypothetical protein